MKPTIAPPARLPRQMGFAMPAEFAPHAATWLAWPHNRADWPGKFAPIPWIFADIVRLIAQGETVHLLVQDAPAQAAVSRILARAGAALANVQLHRQKTDRIWLRDSGPIFVQRPGKRGLSTAACGFRFNAWAKYDNHTYDARLPAAIAAELHMPLWQPAAKDPSGKMRPFVLEGGSIDVNGAGCVLTTEECLLSPVQQRNPGVPRQTIEQTLCDYLGVQQVLWLNRGIAGDDTHGHVDDTARFTAADTIAACVEPNRADDNHEPLAENLRRLKAMRGADGRQFAIAELPMPAPVVFDGQRLPASYANFYIANAGVLVPVFNDPQDAAALKVLEQCFPGRPIVPVYCRDLVWGLGTLHCMTQQQPAEQQAPAAR